MYVVTKDGNRESVAELNRISLCCLAVLKIKQSRIKNEFTMGEETLVKQPSYVTDFQILIYHKGFGSFME